MVGIFVRKLLEIAVKEKPIIEQCVQEAEEFVKTRDTTEANKLLELARDMQQKHKAVEENLIICVEILEKNANGEMDSKSTEKFFEDNVKYLKRINLEAGESTEAYINAYMQFMLP